MKRIWFVIAIAAFLVLPGQSFANGPGYAVAFTQEVVSIAADGTPYPAIEIDPATMEGMQSHTFDLGENRNFTVQTNIADARQRGLDEVGQIVARCYRYLEEVSGRSLPKGVLLYLIEVDEIPLSYTFKATYPQESTWSEVRLALVRRGETLIGPGGSSTLAELLYDTIPHELGHDVLSQVAGLQHDIDGGDSFHTRWFIDGVCELLAKGFARQEAPEYWKHFINMRRVDSVLADSKVREQLFCWSQENGHHMGLESDLYGASMLVLMQWTETVALKPILDRIEARGAAARGSDLVALMEETTGLGREQMCNQAQVLGERLGGKVQLAAQQGGVAAGNTLN